MATISSTPRPGYAWDATDNCWYPIGTGPHTHSDYITQSTAINPAIVDAKGDIIAATAADSVARLAVGANDTVLTADSSTATGLKWAAVAPSGLNLISTTTIGTGVSSISLPNNTFSSTYDNYKIIISLARTTDTSSNGAIDMRYRASGTDNSAAEYNSNGFESRETTLNNMHLASQTSQRVGYFLDDYWSRTAITIDLCGININKQTTCLISSVSMDGGTRVAHQLNGWHNVNASYDSLTFLIASGTITNGRISVYGYQN